MRICFLASGEIHGGVASSLRMLRGLHEPQRYELSYIWLGEGNLQREFDAAGAKSIVVPVTAVPPTGAVVNGRKRTNYLAGVTWLWQMARLAAPVARQLRQWQVDIVYTNEYFTNLVGGLAARICGARSIWHIRMVMSSRLLGGAAVRIYSVAGARLADCILCNSRATANAFSPAARTRLHVLYNCIADAPAPAADCVDRLRREWRAQPDDVVIATVCRISHEKGLDVFLNAAARVAAALPASRFVVVGGAFGAAAEQLTRSLQAQCATGVLAGRVRFLGHRDDVRALYHAMDIVCATSTEAEGFNYSIVEAMAAGKPVVASRTGGQPELVAEGITGMTYAPADADGLAAILLRLGRDAILRRRLGQAGRVQFLERFEASRLTRQLEEVHACLIRQRPGVRAASSGDVLERVCL